MISPGRETEVAPETITLVTEAVTLVTEASSAVQAAPSLVPGFTVPGGERNPRGARQRCSDRDGVRSLLVQTPRSSLNGGNRIAHAVGGGVPCSLVDGPLGQRISTHASTLSLNTQEAECSHRVLCVGGEHIQTVCTRQTPSKVQRVKSQVFIIKAMVF